MNHLRYDFFFITSCYFILYLQYININSFYPYSYSTFLTYRPASNSFIQPMQIEMDPKVTYSNFTLALMHYVSDGIATLKPSGGNDVFRSGFERNSTIINTAVGDKNSIFIHIANSGNQY